MLGQYSIRCMFYFSKRCWSFWDRAQNMLNFWLGVQYPLKVSSENSTFKAIIGFCFSTKSHSTKQKASSEGTTLKASSEQRHNYIYRLLFVSVTTKSYNTKQKVPLEPMNDITLKAHSEDTMLKAIIPFSSSTSTKSHSSKQAKHLQKSSPIVVTISSPLKLIQELFITPRCYSAGWLIYTTTRHDKAYNHR